MSTSNFKINLSDEQIKFIEVAKQGKNILVDACIGSGKTTAIQHLCEELPLNCKILYLTYNKLLKLDARKKIKRRLVTVTNYHGFAFSMLKKQNISAGIHDLVQKFLQVKPPIPHFDILILDEYQDIEQEFAEMLEYIKSANPNMQIVAVGDMEQKIYDKTILNVPEFIDKFLCDYEKLTFTKCFRLSANHAGLLGRIWDKPIIGVNENCEIMNMNTAEVIAFLADKNPKDILCLGSRTGDMSDVQNELEDNYPDIFNKRTLYSSIQDDDGNRAVEPDSSCAIFTTFDSSKGLERKICIVFDFTESYWAVRIDKPQQSFEILRNIFCVAASRGKEKIIFVSNGEEKLSENTLKSKPEENVVFQDMDISTMFDFKYVEDIEECYSLLDIKEVGSNNSEDIKIKNRDELIDLSPCIGIYQEAVFFNGYDIDKSLEFYFTLHPQEKGLYSKKDADSLDRKILLLTRLETRQLRYMQQVSTPFVQKKEKKALIKRLNTTLRPDEEVQAECKITFAYGSGKKAFLAKGLADAVRGDTVYELKFVSELSHVHFLQCASYVVALGLSKGILWNTRNNAKFEIKIPNRATFLDAVAKTVTKRAIDKFYATEDKQWRSLL